MKIIETTFEKMSRERLLIGFEGENQRATVRIDCASVFAEYPNATPALTVKPLFADAYPVVVDRNGTCVDWLITSEILSFTGDGEIQLTFHKDAVICKSAIAKIRVCRSLQVTGDMPDPVAQWVDDANAKLAEVDAQIVELEEMVDTATDAATRAEQSASTASTKAEQAAGSAATATAKATEATNAAGTATAKAAEAQTAAQTATAKATAAAESERIATAKAGEATTAAGTATAKAEQATEAAQTATEKAGDASASATAAHTSEINAAESADDALSAEVGANAAKRAAETSATQAGISEQNAGTAAQTATQKATEATQSATDAATFAGTATTKAEEAATSAQAASDAKTSVEETAEQLADSLEQIEQNTQDIAELDERKANVDGYYPDMTVGNAEQLNSSKFVENSEPYTLRTSGGSSDIGNREYLDAVVGGTVAWNQAVRDEASENETDFAPIVTVTDAVEDAAGVKVKIEPVQDLHGYDHPWPAGGGKNLFDGILERGNLQPDNTNPLYTRSANFIPVNGDTTYTFLFADVPTLGASTGQVYTLEYDSNKQYIDNTRNVRKYGLTSGDSIVFTTVATAKYVRFFVYDTVEHPLTDWKKIQIEEGSTATAWTPYSNICPITGWDGVKVSRTGKNLYSGSDIEVAGDIYYANISYTMKEALKKLKPGQTYICSAVYYARTGASAGISIAFSDGKPSISLIKPQKRLSTDRQSTTFTIPANVNFDNLYYVLAYGGEPDNQTTAYVKDIQIEPGTTATDYEPYAGNTYDITFPTEAGTVYGGELTVNADGSGSLVVDRKKRTFNGQGGDLWIVSIDGGNNCNRAMLETLDGKTGEYSDILSDVFVSELISVPKIYHATLNNNGVLLLGIPKTVTDRTTMNEFASENNFSVIYYLRNPITYTLTASEIRTLLGTNNVWSDAGQLALTYTGTDEHLTLESGKKYLTRISGTDSMLLGSGQEITAAKGTDNVFDLTRMFGTAVADYVYGQGAACFRKWFPNAVYPYNAGELKHVEGLQSHDMVGFNAWDEEWELGAYDNTTGQKTSSSTRIRSKNYIPVVPGSSYYFNFNSDAAVIIGYDSDKNYVKTVKAFTAPGLVSIIDNNIRYITFYLVGTTYNHDICLNLSHSGARNGEYEPYVKHSYPLDSSVILRGVPKVSASGVYWDGDRYLPDGTVERRYGVVDLGTLTWLKHSSLGYLYARLEGYAKPTTDASEVYAICSEYTTYSVRDIQYSSTAKGVTLGKSGFFDQNVIVKDTGAGSAESFGAAMQGVLLVYELATPTTETAQPYHSTQWVSDWGTEEFVSTGIVPVGHETRYPANLRDKLQHLPDAASGNGSYLITQTDGQMVLTPFPAPPSTAGNYVLKATVTNGVATYTWEVAT